MAHEHEHVWGLWRRVEGSRAGSSIRRERQCTVMLPGAEPDKPVQCSAVQHGGRVDPVGRDAAG